MAVEFGTFKRAEGSVLEEQGTLKALAGKGGSIGLIRKNWNDKSKRVAVLVKRKDGKSAVISCSSQVSDSLRAEKMTIAQLIGLNVVSNEKGHNFISMPATGAVQEISVDKVKEEEFTSNEEFIPESLVAF